MMLPLTASLVIGVLLVLTLDFALWRRAHAQQLHTNLHTLIIDGQPVLYSDIGKGEPILYVFGGGSGPDSAPQFQWLAQAGYRLVSVNRPGYLGAPLPSTTSFAAHADLYAKVLDALGIAQTHVFGVSMGGPSALYFVERHPQRARTLILWSAVTGTYAPNPKTTDTLMSRIILGSSGKAVISWLFARAAQLAPTVLMASFLKATAKLDPQTMRALITEELDLPHRRNEFAAFVDALLPLNARFPGMMKEVELAAENWECPPRLSSIAILSAHSPLDLDVPPSHQDALHLARPDGLYLKPRSGGHFCFWGDEGEHLRQETLAFLHAHPLQQGV